MSKKTGIAPTGWVKINIYPNTFDEQKTKIARTGWVKINIYPNTFDEQKTGIAGAGWVKIAVARIIAASGGCRPRFCCTTNQASLLFSTGYFSQMYLVFLDEVFRPILVLVQFWPR